MMSRHKKNMEILSFVFYTFYTSEMVVFRI